MVAPKRDGIRLPTARTLGELAAEHGGTLDEALAPHRVERVVPPSAARAASDLVVLTAPSHADAAARSGSPVLCADSLATRIDSGRRWRHDHVMWVVARLLEPLVIEPPTIGDRPQAIAPEADVASDVTIGAGAVVCAGSTVGAESRVGENAVVYGGSRIGRRVTIGAGAVVGRPGFGFASGPSGAIVRIPQLGGVHIDDDVEIGALCTIDAGTLGPTTIGRGTKLDAQVHVGHNVHIGERTMVAAQTGFAGSVEIGCDVLVGGQAGFADHVRIGDGARVAAKSGVIGDVPKGAVVAGFPAVPRMRWLRGMAALLRGAKVKR